MAKIARIADLIICGGAFFGIFLLCSIVVASSLVNINTAGVSELDTLPGVGEKKAEAIIDYRNTNGEFQTIEEIMNVSGIGESTYDGIKDLITVGSYTDDDTDDTQMSSDIVINELMANPEGSDDYEWIELKNIGSDSVDLNGWRVEDASGKSYELTGSIDVGDFYVIEKSTSGISLNNSGDQVLLYDASGVLVNETQYTDDANDNVAWAWDNGYYRWTTSSTKGGENVINEPEDEDEESGSSSGSSGSGGLIQANSEFFEKVFISELMIDPVGIDNGQTEWIEISNVSDGTVCLNGWRLLDNQGEYELGEIFVPAHGYKILNRKDTGIELNNTGGDELKLKDNKGWVINQVKIPSKTNEGEAYSWCPEHEKWFWLSATGGKENVCPPVNEEPFAYFEISDDEVELGDYLQLSAEESYDKDGQIVKYKWSFDKEVNAFGKTGKVWEFNEPIFEVKMVEVGKIKIELEVMDDLEGWGEYYTYVEVIGEDTESTKITETQKTPVAKMSSKGFVGNYRLINLGDIADIAKGTKVKVQGAVVVEPGLLGKNIFYINDENGGVQIYMFSKDFPGLAEGDLVRVTGEISEAYGEKRVKTTKKEDIQVIESGKLKEPVRIDVEDVGEEYEGMLVVIDGDITEVKTSDFWLDDMTNEVKIYIKRNTMIDISELNVGDLVRVTGIVTEYNEEYRVLPRYRDDIIIVGQIQGASVSSKSQITNNKNYNLVKYVIAVIVAGLIIGLSLFLKKRKII